MDSNDILKKLKLIKQEDYIWIVYFFIVTFAIISNYYERNYIFTRNNQSFKTYHGINTVLLITALIIYLYYLAISYDELRNSNPKNAQINFIREVGAILFVVAGIIYIYVDLKTRNDDIFDDNIGFI